MITPRRIARTVVFLWLLFLASWVLFTGSTLVFVHIFGGSKHGVLDVASAGMQNVSKPVMGKVVGAGLPEFMGFFVINGSATLVIFLFPAIVRLLDPSRNDWFTRMVRRLEWKHDPTDILFMPLPAFRRISVRELRDLFQILVIPPFLMPILLGVVAGMLCGLVVKPGDIPRTALYCGALIMPHGILEASAIFLVPACMFSLYREVRTDMAEGRTEAVWAVLRPELRWRRWLPRLVLALGLIAAAGVIEAYATKPIADALGTWMGMDIKG
ncbi:MAG: stage II sporulation protein M [Planctomycetota bacterium]|jgi:hypothetical protein